jgi:YD repeat-containing protein
MAVTVSGPVATAVSPADSRSWQAYSPEYRQGVDGQVVTTQPTLIRVVAGVFSAQFEPGPLVLINPDGRKYNVTVPETDIGLWELIEASATLPPSTPAQQLAAAVETYLVANPVLPDATEFGLELLTQTDAAGIRDSVGVAAAFPAELVIAYDEDGNVETVTEDGITTAYTYNADGTVDTDTRGAVTRQYTYVDGDLTGIEVI